MNLAGVWFPANSSNRHEAQLVLGANGDYHLSQAEEATTGDVDELVFSDRIGNIPRKITLPDGSIFQTQDNESIDKWLKDNQHKNARTGWIHSLETNWRAIGVAVIGTILFGFLGIKYGLPWASHKIAYQLPVSANVVLSDGALKTMDKLILEPSSVSKAKQEVIQSRFKTLVDSTEKEGFEYQLHFRKMNNIPNAFALPSGTIVVTDRLVEIVEPEELDAILLHEIGHVTHRHGMRQVIQSSALTIAVVMWTGDSTAVDEWVTGLPVFLLQSSYSKGFETESDIYAFENMIKLGIDPANFGSGLKRITSDVYKENPEIAESAKKAEKMMEYFSSHPATEDRAKLAQEYSERFHQLKN